MPTLATPATTWTGAAVVRQPLRDATGEVTGYAVDAVLPPPAHEGTHRAHAADDDEAAHARSVAAAWAGTEPAVLSGGLPLLVRATPALLRGDAPSWHGPAAEVVLELPGRADPEAVLAATGRGQPLALGDYVGTAAQDALLRHVSRVVVDASDSVAVSVLSARAHAEGVMVVARGADTVRSVRAAFAAGADEVQGPLVEVDAPMDTSDTFAAAQLPCLELLAALAQAPVDIAAVVGLVTAEPALSVRVLRLVNSSASGLSRHVDSVRQAVMLVGPRQLRDLAVASLVDADRSSMHQLWATLSRALTCWILTHDDAGYTVGLMSSVAEQQHVPAELLARRARVSGEVADALIYRTGRAGAALRAVVALESGALTSLPALGHDPVAVSRAWQDALRGSLSVARALADA